MNTYSSILAAIKDNNNYKAIQLLQENIREESARAAGKATTNKYKVVKTLMKNADTKTRPLFSKAHFENGYFSFIDGYRIFRSESDFGFEHADENERFKNIDRLFNNPIFDDTLTLNRAEIQAFIKIEHLTRKGAKKPFLLQGKSGDIYGFNPFYLLDYMDFTGEDIALAYNPKNPITNADKTALILPINHGLSKDDFIAWRARYFETDPAALTA